MKRGARWVLGGLLMVAAVAAVAYVLQPKHRLLVGASHTADPASLRVVAGGQIVGFRDGAHFGWLGVPYASAERWRAPVTTAAWSGVREAVTHGPTCYQFQRAGVGGKAMGVPPEEWGKPIGVEDCLTLNIRAPVEAKAGDHLPVMVWLPGGANTVGDGELYDFSAFVEKEKVIVVTVNYRLGIFGWFAHPALQSSSDLERSGNFGLLDMMAALRWVHTNITPFGGDPDNLTLFGVSTGGSNTLALMMSPVARGLFQKAIIQSGPIWHDSLASAQNYRDDPQPGRENSAREVVNKLLIADGLARDRAEAKHIQDAMPPAKLDAYLRAKSADALAAPLAPNNISGMYQIPNLILDGTVLPRESFVELLGHPGSFNSVPVIIGSNRDEMKFFMMMDPRLTHAYFNKIVKVRDPHAYERESSYRAIAWRGSAVEQPARELSGAGVPIYVYRFDWDEHPSNILVDLRHLLGAAHSLETAFVSGKFENFLGLPWVFRGDPDEPARDQLSAAMMSYWAQFAYTGSPGSGRHHDLPEWERWSGEPRSAKTILFATAHAGGIRMSAEGADSERIKEQLAGDASLSVTDRCRLYVQMYSFPVNAPWQESDYRSLGCAQGADARLADEGNLTMGSSGY